ncbi:MAG: hypothetical protein C4575_12805 [Desulforudis sp.]|nr:MAG: hypothetical protein C4575_12805 [Desulforudis sp.]
MNASELKGNPLYWLPPEVVAAALTLAEYQEKTGYTVNFCTLSPHPAERFLPASPQRTLIKIENVSSKTVHKLVKKVDGLELTRFLSGYPEIYIRDYQTEKATFTLHIAGDREENIKAAIAKQAMENGKAAAEWVADQLMRARSEAGEEDGSCTP